MSDRDERANPQPVDASSNRADTGAASHAPRQSYSTAHVAANSASAADSASAWQRLDELCDRFETAWLSGQQPNVEEYLSTVPDNHRGDAVRELLKLDAHYRRKSGSPPPIDEYRQRFPSLASVWLREVLEPAEQGPPSPAADAPAAEQDTGAGGGTGLPRVPGYEVLELLGRGGMGVVYKARDLRLHRLVALKMISAGAAASLETLDRFRAEARAVASLQHPNLVQIYEVGEHEGRPYLVFEYMAGGSLDGRLRGVPQAPRWSAQLIRTVAHAIQFAHTRGFIHRDLKPANILMSGMTTEAAENAGISAAAGQATPTGPTSRNASTTPHTSANLGASDRPSGRGDRPGGDSWREADLPKVGDFGLAKDLESEEPQTRTGAILGTPSYMAPEQADGRSQSIGPATDVYALGAILYEMLTGRPPFRAPTLMETLDQVRHTEPVPPRRIQPNAPRDLETICLKCLQKEPARRYESAGALADDLDRFTRDEPVLARPVSTSERTWRWCRRHPLVATLALLLFVITAGGVGGIVYQWQEAEAARELAEENAKQARKQRDDARRLRVEAESHLRQAEAAREHGERLLYLRDVNAAEAAFRIHDYSQAVTFLQNCRPDLRDWEWRHQQRRLQLGAKTLDTLTQIGASVRITPDGKTLIASSGGWLSTQQGELAFWEFPAGRHLETRRPHAVSILDVAVHPQLPLLATAGLNWYGRDVAKLTDAQTGQVVAEVAEAFNSHATGFSPDGRWLAFAGSGGRLYLCDGRSGKVARRLSGHAQTVFCVAFSRDSRRLASGSRDGTVRLWDVETGESVRTLLDIGDVRSIAFSPDGFFLAALTYQGYIRLWNAEGTMELDYHHTKQVGAQAIAFSPDAQWLAVASGRTTVQLWDPMLGSIIRELPGHRRATASLGFSPEGRWLVTTGEDKLVRIHDLAVEQDGRQIEVQQSTIADFALSPNSDIVATAADERPVAPNVDEKIVRLWSVDEERELRRMVGHTDWLTSVALSPDGKRVVSASRDKTVRIWDADSGKALRTIAAHDATVRSIAYSADGQTIVSAGDDGLVRLWDADTGELVRNLSGPAVVLTRVFFTRNGQHVVGAVKGRNIRVWPIDPPGEPFTLDGHQGSIRSLAMSSDGCLLASAGEDRKILLWELAAVARDRQAARPTREFATHDENITGLDFSPGNRRLVSSSVEHGTTLWDVTSGVGIPLTGAVATQVRFSGDGHRLVGAMGRFLSIWDDRTPQEPDADQQRRRSIAWHKRESRGAELRELPYSVMHHLQLLPDEEFADNSLRLRRAVAQAQLGNWHAAAGDFEQLARDQVNVSYNWYCAAILRLRGGHCPAYDALCRRLRDDLVPPYAPGAVNAVAWIWCCAEQEPAALDWLREELERELAKTQARDARLARLNTLGAILYRLGRWEDAVAQLEVSIRERGQGGTVEDWLFLAMAFARLNRADEARRRLEQARSDIEQLQVKHKPPERRRYVGSWESRVTNEMLLKEAESLIDSLDKPADDRRAIFLTKGRKT